MIVFHILLKFILPQFQNLLQQLHPKWFMMSVIHISHFYMIPWSIYCRLYNKNGHEKIKNLSFHPVKRQKMILHYIKLLPLFFRSSINGIRWGVEWSYVFQHKSEACLLFGRSLEVHAPFSTLDFLTVQLPHLWSP